MPTVKSEKKEQKTINKLGPEIAKIKHPTRLIVSGQSTCGKTTLAVDIICSQILKDVRRCFAVCPTFKKQQQLQRLRDVPGAFIPQHVFTRVTERVFEAIFHICSKDRIPTLLFLDDAAAESSTNKGNKGAFARLCYASPHLNLTIVGVFQKLTTCSPALRDNTECLIQFMPSRRADIDILLDEYNPFLIQHKKEGEYNLRRVLQKIWGEDTFVFIWKQPRRGRVIYHVAFDYEVH